jgi:hypothetical protein
MIRWVRRVAKDLSEGRNIELYFTIALAVAVGTCGVFNVLNADVVASATLATLALLAYGSIGSRENVDRLQNEVTKLSAEVRETALGNVRAENFFFSEAPKYGEFESAREIALIGATLSRTVIQHAGVFERRLKSGASIRCAIIDPKSGAASQQRLRSIGVTEDSFYEIRIKPTVDLLQIVNSLAGEMGSLELRFLPYVPSFGIIAIDPAEADGVIYVDIYRHKSLEDNPIFKLERQCDQRWYDYFLRQYDVLWESARRATEKDGFKTSHEDLG